MSMLLTSSAKKILNDPEKIQQRDLWFSRLHDLYNGNYTGKTMSISGICGSPKDGMLVYSDPEQWVTESLENLAEKIGQCDDSERYIPYCLQLDIYGVHFIDKIFGANVYFNTEANQWYSDYLDCDVGALQYPDLTKCKTWELAKAAAIAFIEQEVALPLFGLPTIASTLNVAVNLYGEKILLEMMSEPEKAARDLSLINNLLMELHQWYRSVLPEKQLHPVIPWERGQPPGYGQICGCTTQLVGADLYREQIARFDDELLGVYPHGGMMHLCGTHSQLIPVFKEMKNLKSIQVNDRAAEDLDLYFKGLREDQIIYYMPCEGMPVEKAMQITGGKRIVIQEKINI